MTTVVAAIISRNSRILICQRRADKAFPLKWEFPGGKVEAGETLLDALAREICEELGTEIEIGREAYRTQYRYAELPAPIELVFHLAKIAGEHTDIKLSDEQRTKELAALNASGAFTEVKWVDAADLTEYDFLAANAGLVSRLAHGDLALEELKRKLR